MKIKFLRIGIFLTAMIGALSPKWARAFEIQCSDQYEKYSVQELWSYDHFTYQPTYQRYDSLHNLNGNLVFEVVTGKPDNPLGILTTKQLTLEKRKADFDKLVSKLKADEAPIIGYGEAARAARANQRLCIDLKEYDILHAIHGVSQNTLTNDRDRDRLLEYMVTTTAETVDPDNNCIMCDRDAMTDGNSKVSVSFAEYMAKKAADTERKNQHKILEQRRAAIAEQIGVLKSDLESLKYKEADLKDFDGKKQ